MEEITLEQHLYSSATLGLTRGAGCKSVARSASLARHEAVEAHCFYNRPKDRDGLEPVNWGWFWLSDKCVCLHRIGYSGTDDVNRPGNYMCHNLMLSADCLDAIDYDIPTLVEWVHKNGPQYPIDAGKSDGFVRGHRQFYRSLGWDPNNLDAVSPQEQSRLARLPLLKVPVADLRQLRDDIDERFLTAIWNPVIAVLGEKGLHDLLCAFLADPDGTKSVLILGVGDGENESSTEWLLVQLLFSILPYHCRRRLTFTTYEPEPLGTGRKAAPHRMRRLQFSTRFNRVTLPNSPANYPLWVVNGVTQKNVVPAETPLVCELLGELAAGRWQNICRWRNFTSQIAFKEELHGLNQAWRLWKATSGEVTDEGIGDYCEAAVQARAGAIDIVELGARYEEGKDFRAGAGATLQEFTRVFLTAAAACHQGLQAADLARWHKCGAPAISRLLWRACWARDAATTDLVLQAIGKNGPLRELAKPCLQLFVERFARTFSAEKLEAKHLTPLARVWDILQMHMARDVLASLMNLPGILLNCEPDVLRPLSTSLALPVFSTVALADVAELNRRLACLRGLGGGGGQMLLELHANKLLTSEYLKAIREQHHDLLLRFFPEWQTATAKSPTFARDCQGMARSMDVCAAYWRTPGEDSDELLDHGLVALLDAWENSSSAETLRNMLRPLFLEEGQKFLRKSYDRPDRIALPDSFFSRARAHTRLLEFVGREIGDVIDKLFFKLWLFLLKLPRNEKTAGLESEHVFDEPARLFCTWYVTPKKRLVFIRKLGRDLSTQSQADANPPQRDVLQAFHEQGLTAEEGRWLCEWLFNQEITSESDVQSSLEDELQKKLGDLMCLFPRLALRKIRSDKFGEFVIEHLKKGAWQYIATDVCAASCCDFTDDWHQAQKQWFQDRCRPLVDVLDREKMLEPSFRQRFDQFLSAPCFSQIKLLDHLLLCKPPPSLAHLTRDTLRSLMIELIKQYASGAQFENGEGNDLADLCAFILEHRDHVDEDVQRKYCEVAMKEVPQLSDEVVAHVFPKLFQLSADLDADYWNDFFSSYHEARHSLTPLQFQQRFVDLVKKLFAHPAACPKLEAISGLFGIRENRRFANRFYIDLDPATGTTSAIANIAARQLRGYVSARDLQGIAGHVQFLVLWLKDDAKAVSALVDLVQPLKTGQEEESFGRKGLAAALLGYVSCKGLDAVEKRWKEAKKNKLLRKAFKPGKLREDLIAVCREFGMTEAEDILSSRRQKSSSRGGRLLWLTCFMILAVGAVVGVYFLSRWLIGSAAGSQ